MKYIEKFQKFMKGRYGPDELYNFLFKLYIALVILNLFINSIVIFVLEILLIIIIFYRFFSKKIYIRSNENQKYLKIKKKIFSILKNSKTKDKEHIYKKCYKCKTILKLPLPSKIGFKKAKCPKCGNRVKFFTLKKEKIEIIRDGKKIRR